MYGPAERRKPGKLVAGLEILAQISLRHSLK
jgi:hypothetical protein